MGKTERTHFDAQHANKAVRDSIAKELGSDVKQMLVIAQSGKHLLVQSEGEFEDMVILLARVMKDAPMFIDLFEKALEMEDENDCVCENCRGKGHGYHEVPSEVKQALRAVHESLGMFLNDEKDEK